ncbi:glycosyltransferase family 2 protein [Patescibacteria group bacterium]|nr:glycosyltransferase family 2 protein [Patescibacteria group bacterium]MBU4452820.1 glycosyltransferase family 2 protein [Patescibacteria group bacterium]MCG2687240.1 glycosyltransferase family 2 protein [Candidatus Parcubacteria bacterium]
MKSLDLSIVVLTYKESLDVLKACFDSVENSKNINYELIVVDNGASDATKGLLQSYKNVTYLRNKENLGFSKAVNRGISIAQGRYILLLNPDVQFERDVLASMISHLDEDQEVGIASCVINYPDGSLQESIRCFPKISDQLLVMLKIPHIFKENKIIDKYMMRDVDPHKTQDVESIMGAFMFIRREVVEQVGYLDEQYFIWFEEVDYCKMTHGKGWKIRHYGDVLIKHHKGKMFDKIATIKKQKWIRQSMRKYMLKHEGRSAWFIFWILAPLFIALGYLSALFKRG